MRIFGKWIKKKWVPYTVATCSAVILYFVLSHIGGMLGFVSAFFAIIKPIIMGVVVAYIFNPLANLFDRKVLAKIKNEKTRWLLSVALAIIVIILCITLLCIALIPQLAESIVTLVNNMGDYLATLQGLLKEFEKGGAAGFLGISLSGLASIGDKVVETIGSFFRDNMESVYITGTSIGKGVFDLLIALILAIYFLTGKRRIVTGLTRLLSLLMKDETFNKCGDFMSRCNDILVRYISVDIVEGLIVGAVNFLFMLIMGMPYSVLISVIVGVTNLAPTFGPIIGAVLGGFILVLVNPWHALWFLVFTVVLQTVDGYILKPKLFGDSLGVSSLMILIAIVIGGRLFGVVGILLAIPFAAIIDFTWKDFVIKKLEERKAKRYNI
jgi:predicted PurR-regulated permease PerM